MASKNVVKQIGRYLFYWAPPFLLMGFIFMLSSRQSIGVSNEASVNFVVFKTLHIIEYAILYFLFFRALYLSQFKNLAEKALFTLPILLAVLYGIIDEIHQTFVPTRTGKPRDVFIDLIGIVLAFLYTKRYIGFIRKHLF